LRINTGARIQSFGAHQQPFFFCIYGGFYKIDQLRCTPREYGLSGILRVANDAVPDESRAVGKNANNADADRGFFEQK
jgi:hypothetical protein